MEEFLSSQEFYELMQDYRNAPYSDQDKTIKAFEAVKEAIQVQAKVIVKLADVISVLDKVLGDTDPDIDDSWTDEEIKDEYPVFWVFRELQNISKFSE